ncbi:VOC family protein [Psychroflexus planctonicus]|uniref:VOC family protein n=1 Tax=Psychroflexus planctonicus TaxID=1526575 RepID=A0ABQ1SP25_9FLAO|nr:VOC family protein [Psychroflexus planctonicus]GGE44297.1 VOC family protein [Psychroflexus planctonicus]
MKIQAYLSFNGQCQQAFDFYQSLFGGEIINRQTYENQKIDIPEQYRNKLQHAELKGKGFHIMGYDASPDTPITNGTNVQMSIDFDNHEKAKEIFKHLAASGKIQTDFQKTSWGAHFGRITDQFGIGWMINAK